MNIFSSAVFWHWHFYCIHIRYHNHKESQMIFPPAFCRKTAEGILFSLFLALLILCMPAMSKAEILMDTDGDGLSDTQEAHLGSDINNPDSDGDGVPDSYEVSHGLDPLNSSDASLDSDHDGASNLTEYSEGTNPANRDR